ncbi:MAG: hypothetical protein GTO02_00095 [Candidatus Dadabacteria bacterium]|nr:hypothetical protein [Candidatus Dadabacteria bacterium]
MNSIHKYSLKLIKSYKSYYILTLELGRDKKSFYIYNIEELNKNKSLIAVEKENDISCVSISQQQKLRDLTIYGNYSLKYYKGLKIFFEIEGSIINGSYVLLVPSWGTRTKNRMWLLIMTNKKNL